MNAIKKIMLGFVQQYAKYNPEIWIPRYCWKELSKKEKAVKIKKIDSNIDRKVKNLWGKGSRWFDFYYTIGEKDKAYLYFPDPWFYKYVDASLNDWKACEAVDDKSLYDYFFADVNRPKTLVKISNGIYWDEKSRIISINDAVKLCRAVGGVIVKPSHDSVGGHGIAFWNNDCDEDIEDILRKSNDVVVQELIQQHSVLSAIHHDSVNTIRIMTMTTEKGVKIISSILRMGVGKSKVDNVSSGGIAVGIDSNGILKSKAFAGNGTCYTKHPDGACFTGVKIPGYHECLDISKKIAPRLARYSRLTSWDFAIDKEGKPILIEANLHFGELDFHQMCNGPIFGDEDTTIAMINKFYKK